jgi:hypothetical protein
MVLVTKSVRAGVALSYVSKNPVEDRIKNMKFYRGKCSFFS